ncbi:MAG: YidC/Oxa1 family membrane protein insertase, partial [Spirochaetia bacterium]|nr:YidC/Oxa1 family membrane protein insertase [Spirochaetia bacterium]
MFPLFYIAEVWKRKEQAVEKRMKHRLAYIKKYYTGQKRYCMIKATHRLEGYTAASSFRTSFGLLIQIPFFFAAYHLLSHYEPYRGVGWLFIKDFAVPDGLLWGLNLLPIVMTVINIVSSSIYMRGSRAKDIVELYVMAGVFLLLLYASPAALVLYWTMNNIFSIGKSLIFLRLFPHEKYVPDPEDKSFKDYVQGFKAAVRPCLTPAFYLFAVVAVLFTFQCWQITFNKETFEKLFLVTSGVAFVAVVAAFVAWLRRLHPEGLRYPDTACHPGTGRHSWPGSGATLIFQLLFFGACYLAFAGAGFYGKLTHAEGGLLRKLVLISTIFADILLFISAVYLSQGAAKHAQTPVPASAGPKGLLPLYRWSTAFLVLFVTIISPVLVFLSSPAETGITLGHLLLSNIPVAAVLLLIAFLVWKLVQNRQSLVLVSVAAVLILILYQYILPNNFGELDRTVLGKADQLRRIPVFFYCLDVFILCASCIAAGVLVRRYPAQCKTCIIVILVCLCGFTGVKSIKYALSEKPVAVASGDTADLPADNDLINGYSKTGKNVVLIVADMFSGGYMERILAECPEYKNKLSGFTWHRNMLAAATETATSMPSIFAGEEYLPLAMNNMPGSGDEKVNRSADDLFRQAEKQGYKVSVVGGGSAYLSGATLAGTANSELEPYQQYWEKVRDIKSDSARKVNQGHLLTMLTIFQGAPYFLKPVIYNDGGWLIFSRVALFWYVRSHVFSEYSFLDLLPEISNSRSQQNTFKYFHSCFTHIPYGIGKDGNLVDFNSQYPDEVHKSFIFGESAYYTAKKFISLMVAYTDWLKANGLYDNTTIIIASDHGNDYSENNPLAPEGIEAVLPRDTFNRLNSLFMVKPAGASGAIQVDDTFASNGDINAALQNALGLETAYSSSNVHEGVSPRADFVSSRSNFRSDGTANYTIYQVKDSITDPKNWQVTK